MKPRTVARAISTVTGAALLAVAVSSCQLLAASHRHGTRLSLPPVAPSALTVVLGSPSAWARSEFSQLVLRTVRANETLIVVSAAGGTLLPAAHSPAPPAMAGPLFPQLPQDGATSFQKAQYRKELKTAHRSVRRDTQSLRARLARELRSWASREVAQALAAAGRSATPNADLGPAVTTAVSDIGAVLRQKDARALGNRQVLAIIGSEGATPPGLTASLGGVIVAVANVPATTDDAAWQGALLDAGAVNAFPFSAVTDGLLPGIVELGLAGHAGIAVQLPRIRYGPAQYKLPPSARPALERALRLLTVTYPDARASINGYTDDIAVRGGNRLLSWRRAHAVLKWLVHHGVVPQRLQAIGHGAADPVAPNRRGGQPLNRRVVLIITPASLA